MCSCSGNCNCNSGTIPRGPAGPQGPQGIQGIQGIQGPQGNPGGNGTDGINAYSTLTVGFAQPANNGTRTINVLNNTWMAPGQIIFIGPGDTSTDPGGYYKVNFLIGGSSTQLNVTKLGWVDPNTTFVAPASLVDEGALVTSAGVIGPQGENTVESGTIIFENNNNVQSTGYFELAFLNIDKLVNNNDSIEIESVIRYTDSTITTLGGYKYQIDGSDIQEYTSGDLIDVTDVKYILHKMTITRVSSTVISIRSLIESTDSNGIISTSSVQQYLFTSPTVTDAANLPIRFLLRNNNLVQTATQVVLQVNYIPFIS